MDFFFVRCQLGSSVGVGPVTLDKGIIRGRGCHTRNTVSFFSTRVVGEAHVFLFRSNRFLSSLRVAAQKQKKKKQETSSQQKKN
jgi:hypothetical protein